MEAVKWGVVGTGHIAGNFAECMTYVSGARKTAVTGTSIGKARDFATRHGFDMSFSDFGRCSKRHGRMSFILRFRTISTSSWLWRLWTRA